MNHIRNIALLAALTAPIYAAPKKKAARPSAPGGVLVFGRGQKWEAVRLGQETPFVLRDSFLFNSRHNVQNTDWKMSPDGRRIAFADVPRDLPLQDNAASAEISLFTARFNAQERVFLGAYRLRAFKRGVGYEFGDVSWSVNQKYLVVSEQLMGMSGDRGEVDLFDSTSRREIWSSRRVPRQFLESGAKRFGYSFQDPDYAHRRSFFAPVLPPDGKDLVCLSALKPIDTYGFNQLEGAKAPPTFLIHFDLKHKASKVVGAIDDEFSVLRYRLKDNAIYGELPLRAWHPQFLWHPTQKKVVFVGPASPTDPTRNLFSFDLPTKKLTRLTHGAQDDFSPQWSLDGKQLFWIRGSVDAAKAKGNRIFRANADGTGARAILPQVQGVTRIQLLPLIADWGRYRKLNIEPLAGRDK